ncbi:3-hydroxy-9,10-secoandrosta-1,3,5(10)-triene-9,17-dione monooxygenase reductase subunit [Kutzneria sp. CA-103260]|uniref:3-hydroxy-9,10-secoandrosta-1,3,5(10)-triene-9, 17-dione monooxygenase reductase subunit n=1 Tax=Kutzneria sp. CA-103260 TaxID=2802641 RepID=UPI001BA46616|nr:3-hydroxy-9,10-secoandrosta-1,3,5(10)-triene-9,17-dione monooxygenase reductase subunit [Kutzneria sp. CA-103260]QUQ63124.1 flavin reductase domain-containing protein [Kutzneria sp. CA-103260]
MDRFRHVLGHFCTGVTVVTTMAGDAPVGFACQSFAALSLDPPLVLFCPDKRSGTWPAIRENGLFCVNVLAEDQRAVSRRFGTRGADRFSGTGWRPSPSGCPVLEGVLTWIDCKVEDVHDAGDHHVVVGRVTELGECRDGQPLLFYRGAYAATGSQGSVDRYEVDGELDNLLTWSRTADWL